MNPETERSRSNATVRAAPMLAVILAVLSCPMKAAAAPNLHADDVGRVLKAATSYFFQSKVRRRTTDAACYFDPQVKRSMACMWHSYESGADSFYVQQEVRRKAIKGCTESGGQSCVLFYRNGKLRFDGLSSNLAEKFEVVFGRIPSYLSEATPLPEGARLTGQFRERFGKSRDYWEEVRKKRRAHKLSYAICGTVRGTRTSFAMEGRAANLREVRRMCVLNCQVFADWHSDTSPCYVIYEDGKFASAAAQRAVNEQ